MKRSTNRPRKGPGPRPKGIRGRRVIVHLVTEQRRPLFIITGLGAKRGAFYCAEDFKDPNNLEKWNAEKNRRFSIDRLLTPGEKKFFDLYCRLRDD